SLSGKATSLLGKTSAAPKRRSGTANRSETSRSDSEDSGGEGVGFRVASPVSPLFNRRLRGSSFARPSCDQHAAQRSAYSLPSSWHVRRALKTAPARRF